MGLLHKDCDADQVIVGNGEVNNSFTLSHHTHRAKSNVALLVDQFTNDAIPFTIVVLGINIKM